MNNDRQGIKDWDLIEVGDDPDDIAEPKDEDDEDEERGDLLVALLAARCLAIPLAWLLGVQGFKIM